VIDHAALRRFGVATVLDIWPQKRSSALVPFEVVSASVFYLQNQFKFAALRQQKSRGGGGCEAEEVLTVDIPPFDNSGAPLELYFAAVMMDACTYVSVNLYFGEILSSAAAAGGLAPPPPALLHRRPPPLG
jgi:hypothetical protein